MKKIKIFNLFVATIALSFTFGCYDNLGNDVYTKLNEVTIERIYNYLGPAGGRDSTHMVITNFNDTLRINPTFKMSLGDKMVLDNYDFLWKLDSNGVAIDISTDINLVYPIDLPVGGYTVYLFVTEKDTKIRCHCAYPVSVSNLYGSGLLVLTENAEGYSELDMVSYLPADSLLFRNILETSDVPKYKKPIGLYRGAYYSNGEIHILSEEGTYLVNPLDFSFKKGIDEIKYKMMAPTSLWSKGVMQSIYDPLGRQRISVIDGNVFYGDGMNGMIYGYPINTYIDSLTQFKCAPIVAGSYKSTGGYSTNALLYDVTLKRFARIANSSKGSIILKDTPADVSKFSWTTGLDFVTSFHSFFGSTGESTTVLTDNKGVYYAYRYSVPNTGNPIKAARYEITDGKDIAKAKLFFGSATQPYIFYAVGSTIHGYDLANGKKYCYSLDMGAEITAIYDAPTYAKEKGKDIVYIATFGGTPGSGKITKLQITNDPNKVELTPSLFNEKPVVWSGFNKIASMQFK